MIIYEYDNEVEDFHELELENFFNPLQLLIPIGTYLFISPEDNSAWLWYGRRVGIREKFVSATKSYAIRDKHGNSLRIRTEEQGTESNKFKEWIGIREKQELKEIVEIEDTPYNRVLESIRYLMKSKALAYRFWTSEGDSNQANICFQQWEAYSQLCDSIGIKYKGIMDEE